MLPDYKDPSASNVNAAMYACLQPATRDQVYDHLVELDRARVDTATSPDRAVIKGGRRIKGGARKGKKAQRSVQSPAPAFSFGGSSAVYTFGAAPAQDAGTPMFGGRGAASAAAATAFSFDGASAPTCTPPFSFSSVGAAPAEDATAASTSYAFTSADAAQLGRGVACAPAAALQKQRGADKRGVQYSGAWIPVVYSTTEGAVADVAAATAELPESEDDSSSDDDDSDAASMDDCLLGLPDELWLYVVLPLVGASELVRLQLVNRAGQ